MKNNNLPMCDECHEARLELSVGWTGADWNSEAGEGSGFGWEVSLVCPRCGRCYVVCHTKDVHDISPHIAF